MFRVCPHCDFEWHVRDGESCPVCQPDTEDESDSASRSESYDGGAFGSGSNASRMSSLYRALGLVALVFLIYLLFGRG